MLGRCLAKGRTASILGSVSEPDLFVVCKNCSSEVSPYVTECPYCGQRVRKRAPKIERGATPLEPRRRRRPSAPSLPRLRRGEIPGIAIDARPYGTGAIVAVALGILIAVKTGQVDAEKLGAVYGPIGHQWWRFAAAPFVVGSGPGLGFGQIAVPFITLVAVAIFGTHLERRFGPAFVVALFILAGAAGVALSIAVHTYPAFGANGAALGLLAAWLVDDRLSAARGSERGNDLVPVWVYAAVLFVLPVADTDVSFFAGVGGAAVGAAAGALVSPFRP